MILGLGGKLSGGKTVTAVRYCLQKGLQGKKIISNIKLNFPKEIKVIFLDNEEFVDYLKENYQNQEMLRKMFFNSVIFLDEIVNLISARKSTTILNELITNFMMMAGKLDADVVYTFQVKDSQVDLRLREISQVYGNCYRYTTNGVPLIDKPRIINQEIIIVVILEYDFDILGKKIGAIQFNPKKYYHLYDTREVTLLDRSKYMSGGIKDLKH